MTAGLVVAGGYSTRFGVAEKPLVEVDGEPMLSRVARTLSATVDDVVIDCRADQVAPFETALSPTVSDPTFVVDDEPDAGPIVGLASGLAEIDDGEVVVASCDRPGVTPALIETLCDRRRTETVDVALPEIDGRLQPLCGAYRTEALATAVDRAVAVGDRRLCSIPRSLSRHVLTERALADVVAPGAVVSVDTPLEARRWSPSSNRAQSDGTSRIDHSRSIASD